MDPGMPKPIGGRRVERPKMVRPCPHCGEALGAGYASCPTCHDAIESIWLADWQALLVQEGIAPASRAGGIAPASRASGIALASRAGGIAPASRAGGIAPASRAGGIAPASRAGGIAPASRASGIAPGSPEEKLLAQVVVGEFGRHPWTVVDIAMSLLRCQECGGELGENYATCGECGMAFGASILCEFGATGNEHALHVGRWVLRFPQHHSPNAVAAWRLSMPRLLTGWLPPIEDAQRVMALIKAGRLDEVNELVHQLDQEINRDAI
jgi:uncharacterized protein (UPF0212 family)